MVQPDAMIVDVMMPGEGWHFPDSGLAGQGVRVADHRVDSAWRAEERVDGLEPGRMIIWPNLLNQGNWSYGFRAIYGAPPGRCPIAGRV